eukprot:gnl/TRDRNA2_/TRDRNA2_157887_c0_seq2.p1 gnl/TRDRNA2_/TRDRNA2_157887_c0~~gnl/TRDRNA2_/TRDRNA2_157887_c0_seq2.p1  ORF type:complete len:145 (+),score=14.23 gnl/TRDRNA2_/TRDRNA2_157887_c0_seq2:48-437(+)
MSDDAWAAQGTFETDGKNERPGALVFGMNTKVLVILVLAGCVALSSLFLFGLLLYHLFLIASGKTTKEHRKGSVIPDESDQSESTTFFAPRGPALFDPCTLVGLDDLERARAAVRELSLPVGANAENTV